MRGTKSLPEKGATKRPKGCHQTTRKGGGRTICRRGQVRSEWRKNHREVLPQINDNKRKKREPRLREDGEKTANFRPIRGGGGEKSFVTKRLVRKIVGGPCSIAKVEERLLDSRKRRKTNLILDRPADAGENVVKERAGHWGGDSSHLLRNLHSLQYL